MGHRAAWVVHLNELECSSEIYGFVSLSQLSQMGSPCEPDGLPKWMKWVTKSPPLDLPPIPGRMPVSEGVTHVSALVSHEVPPICVAWRIFPHIYAWVSGIGSAIPRSRIQSLLNTPQVVTHCK